MDYLCLISNLPKSTTIRLPFYLLTPSGEPPLFKEGFVILDTGADNCAFSEQYLNRMGYTEIAPSGNKKQTGNGIVEIKTVSIQGLVLANQFKISTLKVDVLSNWDNNRVVGVIGMDVLTRLTFIMSHDHGKFMLSAGSIPELRQFFE